MLICMATFYLMTALTSQGLMESIIIFDFYGDLINNGCLFELLYSFQKNIISFKKYLKHKILRFCSQFKPGDYTNALCSSAVYIYQWKDVRQRI